jgi:hypothetical protein
MKSMIDFSISLELYLKKNYRCPNLEIVRVEGNVINVNEEGREYETHVCDVVTQNWLIDMGGNRTEHIHSEVRKDRILSLFYQDYPDYSIVMKSFHWKRFMPGQWSQYFNTIEANIEEMMCDLIKDPDNPELVKNDCDFVQGFCFKIRIFKMKGVNRGGRFDFTKVLGYKNRKCKGEVENILVFNCENFSETIMREIFESKNLRFIDRSCYAAAWIYDASKDDFHEIFNDKW